jgi:hypothetical protein
MISLSFLKTFVCVVFALYQWNKYTQGWNIYIIICQYYINVGTPYQNLFDVVDYIDKLEV